MDKFRMMFQFLQSNQESFMNGICGIMALASAQMYSAFEFSCPCMPEYNYSYGIGLLVVPPIWFFMLGFVLNNNVSVLAEEWQRPTGKRTKDASVLRYMFCSITQRSLIAPAVWVSVTLMDGKSFICAFSLYLDIDKFGNATFWKGVSETEKLKLLAKIPCKDLFENHEIRIAASRYIKCISQLCGWMFLLLMTFTVLPHPCYSTLLSLKPPSSRPNTGLTTSTSSARCSMRPARSTPKSFAKQFSGEMHTFHRNRSGKSESDDEDEHKKSDEEKLLGIRVQEDMNKVLWNWHSCKPALALRKDQM
ncbi:unnamed protein product, partial [Tetraodon nigroviridis]